MGIAISEAVEAAVSSNGKFKYSIGSVLGPVLMRQTVVGLEALKQFELADDYPDVLIGCIGGGSNFSGFAFPFLHRKFTEGKEIRALAVEPTACPSLTRGLYTFDYGDTAEMAPIVKMHTLGHTFVPPGIHAVRAAIDEALAAREAGEARTIAFNLSGHGYFDLAAYDSFLKGELENYAYPQALVQEAMARLPQVELGGVRT